MESNIPEFLIEMLRKQYGEETAKTILEGYSKKRYTTLRVNTIKSTKQEIEKELRLANIEFEHSSFISEAFIIKNANEKEIRNMDIYKEGKIYLQSLSSMLPPIILQPEKGKDILDMAAAPGGKTTQIAAIVDNKAAITACEMNKIRAERLKYNIEKQGASCAYVMTTDARNIDDFFSFDQILLDAPCSGSGTININDKNLQKVYTKKLIEKSVKSQESLLRKALKILKPGCEMVYSTCSILDVENEGILNKVLKSFDSQIIPIDSKKLDGVPILPTQIKGTLCVCPNELYEGFFVAKIVKTSNKK